MNVTEFSREWIDAWNSHDLERILSHYTEDVEITSPMIKLSLGRETGSLQGKETVGDYWRSALEKMPDLHFELLDVLEGVNSVAVYYQSVMNKLAIEVMEFNEEGKVYRIVVHYR